MSRSTQKSRRFLVGLVVVMIVLVGVGHYLTVPVAGAQIGQRAMQLSDNEVSVTSDYLLTFNLTTPGTLGSIVVQFCSNSALPGDPCTASSGFDDSAAVLASQT